MKIRFKQDKKTVLKLLKTASTKRKLKIIDRLNGINERDSVSILLKVLEDNSWVMRERAAYRLAGFGNRVVPRLLRLLSRGFWYTRASACLALGEIGNLKSLAALAFLALNDDNPTVVKEASAALVKLAKNKPPEFSEQLKNISLDDSEMTQIFEIIKNIDPQICATVKEEIGYE